MRGAGASSSPTHGTSLLPRSLAPQSALEDTENVPQMASAIQNSVHILVAPCWPSAHTLEEPF